MLPLQGAQVGFLVGELRSLMPHGVTRKQRKKKKVTPLALVGVVLLTADHLQFADAGLELMFAQIDT